MGQNDLRQSEYFDSNVRFADAYNAILFNGESIIKPKELEECDSIFVQLFETSKGKKLIADKVKKWKGQYLAILPLETQTYIDYRMVLRTMMEEVMAYEKQRKQLLDNLVLTKEKLENNNEFLSGMKKDWKFVPVIPLIIYMGKDTKWDGATTLYELLEIDESLKPFVNNYKLNFYDYHNETDFSKFKTENKYLFELLFHCNDQKKVAQIFKNAYNDDNIDPYFADILLKTADISIDLESIKEIKHGKERYNMCKAIDDMKNDARNEGIKTGTLVTLHNLYNEELLSLEKAAEKASMTVDEFLMATKEFAK